MARSVGIKKDLRLDKLETYANYFFLNFRSYLGQNGDSYDRFLIRMNEMVESLNIISQILNKFKSKQIKKNKNFSNSQILLKHLMSVNLN
jgi:NADH:ubiquinone oxidoreductase subunit D